MYKEFFEIANGIIPQILKMEHDNRSQIGQSSLLSDATAFSSLLRFYDGLCLWEEDSNTPVLHITWATHMLSSVSRFDSDARSRLCILENSFAQAGSEQALPQPLMGHEVLLFDMNGNKEREVKSMRDEKIGTEFSETVHGPNGEQLKVNEEAASHDARAAVEFNTEQQRCLQLDKGTNEMRTEEYVSFCDSDCQDNLPKMGKDSLHGKMGDTSMSSDIDRCLDSDDDDDARNKEIAALAHGCCDKLLNPDFLRGSGEPFFKEPLHQPGEPFLKEPPHQLVSMVSKTQMDLNAFAAVCGEESSSTKTAWQCAPSSVAEPESTINNSARDLPKSDGACEKRCQLILRSAKMRALKNLLIASKLNHNAITLQLTAQSQIHLKHRGVVIDRSRRKRPRIS
jgi:hypothetical protein